MVKIRHGVATDTGNLRQQNEDAFVVTDRLIAVADGMGGHNAGEVASRLAVSMLHDRAATPFASVGELVDLVTDINVAIHREATTNSGQRGMGTTLTVAALVPEGPVPHVLIANVGDSRTYLLRDGEIRQITVDHSYVQELVHEGVLTAEEARLHPRRNIVTRALGIDAHVMVDSWTLPVMPGDRFLLCSDGLVDEVSVEDVTALLRNTTDPKKVAQTLVNKAKESGGRDNITAAVLDVLSVDTPEIPVDEPNTRKKAFALVTGLVALAVFSVVSLWGVAARGGYSVSFDGTRADSVLVIRKGTSWLWIKPTVEETTTITRGDVLPALETEIDREPAFRTFDDASTYLQSIAEVANG
ncbi:MAG: Stp1/IreP family PP2C-type Ser/Thr phosphatase [Ilumatobacteraceae bacterium]